jgi:hypothetical protein
MIGMPLIIQNNPAHAKPTPAKNKPKTSKPTPAKNKPKTSKPTPAKNKPKTSKFKAELAAKTPVIQGEKGELTWEILETKVAQLKRDKPFGGRRCWELFRDLRSDVERQRYLLRRLASQRCDVGLWRDCQRKSGNRAKHERCREEKLLLRWSACFRIERRLFVITERLWENQREGRERRCRWHIAIPDRFQTVRFAPHPKLSTLKRNY